VPQRFFTKFPKKINRVKLSDNRDRNRVNSEIQSGFQKRPFPTHRVADGAVGTRGGGEPHGIGKTVNETLDHVSVSRFESSASAGLKLTAVSADEIFPAGCAAIAAAVKRHTPKHSKEVTRSFNPTIGKHW
jgi:hypothetical protein